MSAWTYSLVMGFAVADKDDAEKLSQAMGHSKPGDACYTVEVSPTGHEPITHWFCHSACTPEFAQMLYGIGDGTLPSPDAGGTWEGYGLTESRVWELMGVAIVSVGEGSDPVEHTNAVLASAGLQKVAA